MTTVNEDAYTIKGKRYARVSRILAHCGLTDFSDIPERDREFYMSRGKGNHKLWEDVERRVDHKFDYDPRCEKYRVAHRRFLDETGFKALSTGIERRVWSDDLRVAGTLDRLGVAQGRIWLLDYKTTSLVPATHIQTAIYLLCLPQYEFSSVERYGVAFASNGKYKMSPKYPLTDKREALAHIHRYHMEVTDANRND